MPTGYSSIIDEGATFEEYAWRCARAFGALVMMRDSDMNAPVPERFEPSDYSEKSFREHTERLTTLLAMTPGEIEAAAAKAYEARLTEVARWDEERTKTKALYDAMAKRVRDWEPPAELVSLKSFMLEQIQTGGPGDWRPERPRKLAPGEWFEAEKESTVRSLAHAREAHADELKRTEERNRWLAELRKSVGPPPKPK